MEGSPEWLNLNLRTSHSISFSICTRSSTGKVSMYMVMFSPRGGMWRYSMTRSAVIYSRVIQLGSGMWSTMSLCHPFIQCHDSLWRGVSKSRRASISPPYFSTHHFRSAFNLATIWWMRFQMSTWLHGGSWCAETLQASTCPPISTCSPLPPAP